MYTPVDIGGVVAVALEVLDVGGMVLLHPRIPRGFLEVALHSAELGVRTLTHFWGRTKMQVLF